MAEAEIPCQFNAFMRKLQELRKVEDLIVVRMNKEIPSTTKRVTDASSTVDHSSVCERIYHDIVAASANRKAGIEHCIKVTGDQLAAMKNQDTSDMEFRQLQSTHRLMKRELHSEALVKDQVLKHFTQRCGGHFQPPSNA
eukprot:m.43984 g.43984  ORF g.43984 m.43984 type:complete len:140 (-) comp15072_c0_seq1:155-574(-)